MSVVDENLIPDGSILDTMVSPNSKLYDRITNWVSVYDLIPPTEHAAIKAGTSTYNIAPVVQAHIDAGGRLIYFPNYPGSKFIADTIRIKPGLHLVSHGAILQQPVVPNFTRLLDANDTRASNAAYVSETTDSDPIVVSGFILDGNRAAQGEYTAYQKEQSALVFLLAGSTSVGRLRFIIDNCLLRECTGDGINVWANTDVVVSNCHFWNLFRGSVTITGGNSYVRMSNLRGAGDVHPSSHQIETDAVGSDGSFSCFVEAVNCHFNGGLDVATSYKINNKHSWKYVNCTFGTQVFSINMENGGDAEFVNCDFAIAQVGSRLYRWGHTKFIGCNFTFGNAFDTPWMQSGGGGAYINQSVEFIDSTFTADDSYHIATPVSITSVVVTGNTMTVTAPAHGLAVSDFCTLTGITPADYSGVHRVGTVTSSDVFIVRLAQTQGAATLAAGMCAKRGSLRGIYVAADSATNNNRIVVRGCTFSNKLNFALSLSQGGNVEMSENRFNCSMIMLASTASTQGYRVYMGSNRIGPDNRGYGLINASVDTGSTIEHDGFQLPAERNLIVTTANVSFLTLLGGRLIHGAAAPAATDACLAGDRWRIRKPAAASVVEWAAVNSTVTAGVASWKTAVTLGA